ncbi:EF-Tu C-terminal domain-related protein [Winogradskyella jejuensis]|uniref:Elongation factor Tu C-terminal domain-containing protein n=1 Tax=Winogradskyella jejuensis TaxID=1089305 RepID=A0A1M5VVZ9_9FLAO|nr:hypothetical protein [Winogradskyella jejuensis]SHH79378.1 Elongation factor Tu C-terminal domain-containing protein [Winogradskyella jejuensis]
MDNKIETYDTLWSLVDLDTENHKVKDIAKLFLNAMNDWPTLNQTLISDFIKEFKTFFGKPLTIEKLNTKKFNGQNTWQLEAGSSIAELMSISTRFCNESDFDKITANILNHYNKEFNKVDFIAELQYLATEDGGRKTPAKSGYRPQVKFDFDEMQTSGQQTFINKELVNPGENVKAKIKILSPDYFAHTLIEGMEFEFREGATTIGTGKIEYIVNEKLEKPAGNNVYSSLL